jgi:hypothetical protein
MNDLVSGVNHAQSVDTVGEYSRVDKLQTLSGAGKVTVKAPCSSRLIVFFMSATLTLNGMQAWQNSERKYAIGARALREYAERAPGAGRRVAGAHVQNRLNNSPRAFNQPP